MRLRDLATETAGRLTAPTPRSPSLAYDSRQVTPGALFFCVSGFNVTGALRARRARGRRRRARRRARARARRSAARRPVGARRDGARGRPVLRSSVARARNVRRDRHQRQDDDDLPDPRPARGVRNRQTGLLGTVTSIIAGEAGGAAHDAGGGRPTGRPACDGRRRRRRLRDRGLLARARAWARRRSSGSPRACSRT